MVVSEFGGMVRRLTVNSQNLRRHECSNQTSGIHESLSAIRLHDDFGVK